MATRKRKKSGIHINPANKGKFTAAAKKKGMGVQAYASKVLAKGSKAKAKLKMRANFARNAATWNKGKKKRRK